MTSISSIASKLPLRSAAAIAVICSLAACAGMTERERDLATGAGIGAVAGSVLTGGSAIGTVGGAVVGGAIANENNKKK